MTKGSPFKYFKTSPWIISLAVMLSVRIPLSFRNIENLLHERGIDVSHETIRFWWNRLGPMFASVKINGERHYLLRAVDHEGEGLESVVTKRCNNRAALKILRKLVPRRGRPEVLVTDRFALYKAALRDLGCDHLQSCGRWLNHRYENSQLPFRRRERARQRFRQMQSLQKFVAVHASVPNLFKSERGLCAA